MNAKTLTKQEAKKSRYIRSLVVLHGISQRKLCKELGCSDALISQVIHGHRKGLVRNGKKIVAIKQALARKLEMKVQDLWPEE